MNTLRGIDLNLLVILDALLAERHVSRAAKRLNMSQPAVSHALGRLRHLLADDLLVRGPSGLQPSPRALDLAQDLAEVMAAAHRVLIPAPFDPRSAERTIRIAMSDYGAVAVLPRLLPTLRKEAPGICLTITQGSREEVAQMVLEGALDAAIGVFPHLPSPLRVQRLFSEQFVCVTDARHPLARGRLTLRKYLDAAHALVSVRGEPGGEIENALAAIGRSRRVVLVIPHFTIAAGLIAGTDLLLTVATRAVASSRVFVKRSPPFHLAPFDFVMIYHPRTHSDAAHTWFRSKLLASSAVG